MRERIVAAMTVFGQHAPFLFTLALLAQLPLMALGCMAILLGESGEILSVIAATGSIMVTPLWLGAVFHALNRVRSRGEIEISEAYRVGLLLYPRTMPPFMLTMLAVLAGSMLFVLPGLFVGVKLSLVNCVALFEKQEPLGALRRAWQLSSGYTLEILAYLGVLLGPALMVTTFEALLSFSNPAPATAALFVFISQVIFLLLSVVYACLIYEVYIAAIRPLHLSKTTDSIPGSAGESSRGPEN